MKKKLTGKNTKQQDTLFSILLTCFYIIWCMMVSTQKLGSEKNFYRKRMENNRQNKSFIDVIEYSNEKKNSVRICIRV